MSSIPEPAKGRLFLVGNGPSLKEVDLDRLIGEEAWGMNRIHLWYSRMDWRPTRWWWSDHPQRSWQLDEIFMHIEQYPDEEAWVRRDIGEMLTGSYRPFDGDYPFYDNFPEHVTPWDYCVPHNASGADSDRRPGRNHMIAPRVLCKPGTGIMAMWQQAVWEGYDPIYFLGIDAGFEAGKSEESHFHPEYYDDRDEATDEQAEQLNATIQWQHELIQRWSDENGRSVRTACGAIDVHPRIPFNHLFQ